MKKFIGLFALLFALTGCIEVQDFGDYWKQGRLDPNLEGRWKMDALEPAFKGDTPQTGKFFTFKKAGDHYELIADDAAPDDNDDPLLARTLDVDGITMLMLHEEEKGEGAAPAMIGGDLWPYRVSGHGIEFLRIADHYGAKIPALSANKIESRPDSDGGWQYIIRRLDQDTFNGLRSIAAMPDVWTVWARGEKVE